MLQRRCRTRAGSRTITVPFWSSITMDLSVAGIDSVDRLGDFYFHAVSPDYFKTMGAAFAADARSLRRHA
jgi:hypothetical protein